MISLREVPGCSGSQVKGIEAPPKPGAGAASVRLGGVVNTRPLSSGFEAGWSAIETNAAPVAARLRRSSRAHLLFPDRE